MDFLILLSNMLWHSHSAADHIPCLNFSFSLLSASQVLAGCVPDRYYFPSPRRTPFFIFTEIANPIRKCQGRLYPTTPSSPHSSISYLRPSLAAYTPNQRTHQSPQLPHLPPQQPPPHLSAIPLTGTPLHYPISHHLLPPPLSRPPPTRPATATTTIAIPPPTMEY